MKIQPVTLHGKVVHLEILTENNMIIPNGHGRDSMYYRIIDSDWPAVKAIHEEKLAGPYN